MMKVISLFKNGRFIQTVLGPRQFVIEPTLSAWDGDWALGGLDDSWWFYGGEARPRRACPVFVEGLTLRNVRPGSVIMIEGRQYECPEGGDVELSFQHPGVYEITVSRWPYLDGSYTVENPPPTE
ncbi:hypothetical protein SBO82_17350 [Alcaligenes nematophilus]|uniref:hypothetical protein n=1 Tax=Alcaligenes nematophilus TaxID=2994643 RepID=UPI0024657070|nr:hypothetical protein [Alcaligenes nematophilus]MDH4868732.1 hypothetical protein [Bacillus cereus]MDY7130049.1 hypothetical protein [Alcaligenes nematophilus]